MGLDSVELVLALEERFGVEITDEEAGSVRTVGDLYQVLLAKTGVPAGPDLTSLAFYRTRRAMVEAWGVARREIRPSTELAPLIPWTLRWSRWQSLQRHTDLQIPKLGHSTWVVLGFLGVGLASASILLPVGFLGNAAVGLVIGGGLFWATKPLAIGLPHGVVTIGDLVKHVLALNYLKLRNERGGHTQFDVWNILCEVMVEQLGVEREQLLPDARIAEDLGVD